MTTANRLKDKLRSGKPAFVFSVRMSRTVNIVSLATALGYDAFYVDLQHSSISIDTAAQICTTAMHSDVTAFVRVPSLEPGMIARVLDSGAQGILAPDIRSEKEAKALVQAALIAPRGDRSVGGGIPNPRHRGVPAEKMAEAVNDATLLIAMIETPTPSTRRKKSSASRASTRSRSAPTISPLRWGSGQMTHERVQEAYAKAIAACRAHKQAADRRRHAQEGAARRLPPDGSGTLLLHRRGQQFRARRRARLPCGGEGRRRGFCGLTRKPCCRPTVLILAAGQAFAHGRIH